MRRRKKQKRKHTGGLRPACARAHLLIQKATHKTSPGAGAVQDNSTSNNGILHRIDSWRNKIITAQVYKQVLDLNKEKKDYNIIQKHILIFCMLCHLTIYLVHVCHRSILKLVLRNFLPYQRDDL